MTQLNEYIMSDDDVEKWRSTWDGKWESIPDDVHRYVLEVEKQNLKILEQLSDDLTLMVSNIKNENNRNT